MNSKAICIAAAMLLNMGISMAQSVETYVGHRRAGVDLMWFKYFKGRKGEKTPFLFFSRNRASRDAIYRVSTAPTIFGSTNAVSYNFKNGIGLVAVGSFLNNGFTPKAGIQFVKMKGDFLFFGWFVADLKKEGNLDLFGLFRYQPKIRGIWRVFSQVELFPVYNPENALWNLTQRLRLGVKYRSWAAGAMADFNQSGAETFTKTENIGGFLRYEF